MREIDRLTTHNYHIPSLQLMQAAAEGCLKAIAAHFSGKLEGKKAQILCGPGNNGGDGAALAQELSRLGVHTEVLLFGTMNQTRGDARTNFEIVRRLSGLEASAKESSSALTFVECESLPLWENLAKPTNTFDIIVDALFGTGLARPVEGLFVQVVRHLALIRRARDENSTTGPLIVSIDIPSGLNADLANPIGEAVHADLTVTFTAPKPANVLPPACYLNGRLVVANIGSPSALIDATNSSLFVTEKNDARDWLVSTRYIPNSFKNMHGHALVIAGSRGYSGAAVLCGNAAMKSGAGLVTVAAPASSQTTIAASIMPEVMTAALAETDRGAVSEEAFNHVMQLATRASALAIGPGLTSEDERTRSFVLSVVKQGKTPIVIDADALNCLALNNPAGWPADLFGSDEAPLILTPHQGEMLRLLGTTDTSALVDRVEAVRDFATTHRLIVVLKGSRSLVAAPDGRVFINPTGNAGVGTAGSGDTLTGIITGFIAQAVASMKEKADALSATISALYIAGLAGDFAARAVGMRTMVASDIREHLGEAIQSLDPQGEQP